MSVGLTRSSRLLQGLLVALVGSSACDVGGDTIELPPLPLRTNDAGIPVFSCAHSDDVACDGNVHLSCRPVGEFLEVEALDCTPKGMVCDLDRTCITCTPRSVRCQPCSTIEGEAADASCDRNVVQQCDANGDVWEEAETCDLKRGDACYEGRCMNMCARAVEDKSYVGCEFWAADLDNAAIDDVNNASAQQYAVAVANPQAVAVEVSVQISEAAQAGDPPKPRTIDKISVPPGALEVFELPRREVDGSSAKGLNDGTHTAITPNAYRIDSSHPIIAYQFNPLENVNVFSNDASLLLPTSALGDTYTVVAWPQTIGDSDDPDQDFDSTSSNEDLRAFLTILGTADGTDVHVDLGSEVVKVVGAGIVPESGPGDPIDVTLGRFEVLNLETQGFNADFTGSLVTATRPITVFVGSEASDVPRFGTYATRQCCADHLEEQLIPDSTLGSLYSVARMPARTVALAAAAAPEDPLSIAVVNEPEWVRVVAVATGSTRVTTTLPHPDDVFTLRQGEDIMLRADQDFMLKADHPVSVLQAMASQGVTGIPREYPGGDPSIIVVPPVEQYRRDYVFLTPDKYAFDFVTIMAEAGTTVLLDGQPLPDHCTTSPADGLPHGRGDPPPERLVHRCQLSFPQVTKGPDSRTLPGDQNDGVHTIVADRGVGIVVYGFDRFVSYAYVGGLNLDVIN